MDSAACRLDIWSPAEIAVATPTTKQNLFDTCLEQHHAGQVILPLAEFWATSKLLRHTHPRATSTDQLQWSESLP